MSLVLISTLHRMTGINHAFFLEKVAKYFIQLKSRCKNKSQMREVAGLLALMVDWDGKTFWNYEPAICRRCVIMVDGVEIFAVQVETPIGDKFLLDDTADVGYSKCVNGGGPELGHKSWPANSMVARWL